MIESGLKFIWSRVQEHTAYYQNRLGIASDRGPIAGPGQRLADHFSIFCFQLVLHRSARPTRQKTWSERLMRSMNERHGTVTPAMLQTAGIL